MTTIDHSGHWHGPSLNAYCEDAKTDKPFFEQAAVVRAVVADANRTAIDDRRQRALETYYDEDNDVQAAIETATRVQITPEMIEAYAHSGAAFNIGDGLKAAFEAAGFEVEQ